MSEKDKKEGQVFDEGFKTRVDDFLNMFKKGAEFTEEILKENEKLRYKIAALETENNDLRRNTGDGNLVKVLEKRIKELEDERESILERFKEVEKENRDFAVRYVEVENENNSLANLYIASYELHATLSFKDVLRTIVEIVINLIGGEVFGILLLDEKTKLLEYVEGEEINSATFNPIKIGEGIIGSSVLSGDPYVDEEVMLNEEVDFDRPIVSIPLRIESQNKIVGAIVIYKLLSQKKAFEKVDYELFTLLAGHAATAIFSARLYSESERKLSTIQSFMDMLKK